MEYRIGPDPNYFYPKHKANVSKFIFNKSNIKNMNLEVGKLIIGARFLYTLVEKVLQKNFLQTIML